MKVIYRIAPNQPFKSPFSKEDKLFLVKTCLKSFVKAFEDVKLTIVFILDNCPDEYRFVVSETVPFEKDFIFTNLGNFGTYSKQVEIASETDDFVLLQEDDYLYLPGTEKKLMKALDALDFITPQDEYLYYFDEPRHIGKYEIKVVGGHHFREVNSTTLTFAGHGKLFKENRDTLLGFGTGDYPMWQEIRGLGYRLWCPIPTFATHMVEGILSPTIDWNNIWLKSV